MSFLFVRKKFDKTVLGFCSLLAITGLANAATYYVSTSGSDSNAGTQTAPFRHVSKGAAVARAGDTVVVMDGTYDNEGKVADISGGGSVVVPRNSGAAGAPITFIAQNRGKAILDASSTVQSSTMPGCYGAWSYFDLYNASYITIQGFVIKNACLVGIASNGTGQHDYVFKQNEIANIGNNFTYPGSGGPQGLFTNGTEYNVTIDSNIIHDIGGGTNINQQHGVYTYASNVTITNNIFYNNNHGWDIQTSSASSSSPSTNIFIANNTFAFKNPYRDGHIIVWDGDHAGGLKNLVIQNNVSYQPGAYMISSALSGPINGCTIANNITTTSRLTDGSSNLTCTQSNNVLNTNPQLVNVGSAPYDFHLQSGSAAIDTGANNSYTTADFDNWPRPVNATYDRGAYEFHSASTPTASISLSATPTSLSLVQGGSGTATITANVSGSASPVFSVSGLPSGVTASFFPSSCNGSCTTTLTLNATGTYQGTTNITVAANSGSTLSASATITLSVVPATGSSGGGSSTGDFTTGLVGEWKLQTNANDSVKGLNGALNGGGVWGYGLYNSVDFRDLVLDGSSGFVSVPEASQLQMRNQLTVAFWIRALPPPSSSNTDPRVISKVYDWEIKLNGTLYPQFSANGMYAMINYAMPQAWTHVVFTFASGVVKAYVNGQPVSLAANTFKSNSTLPTNAYGLYIGTNSSRDAFYSGGMNDVRIYNRALASADVAALYSAVTPATLK